MSIYDLEMSAKTCGFANEHCDGYNWMRVVPDFLFFFCVIRSFKGLPFILFILINSASGTVSKPITW